MSASAVSKVLACICTGVASKNQSINRATAQRIVVERRPVDRAVSNDDRTAMSVQLLENEFSEQQDISPLLRESIVEANKDRSPFILAARFSKLRADTVH